MTPDPAPRPQDPASEPVIIGRTLGEDLQVALEIGPHTVRSDAAVEHGGGGSAPSPTKLMLGSLAACTAMTVRLYADRKGWPITAVEARVRSAAGPLEDGSVASAPGGRTLAVTLELAIEGPALTADQRERLRLAAGSCPVHRALSGNVAVDVVAAGP